MDNVTIPKRGTRTPHPRHIRKGIQTWHMHVSGLPVCSTQYFPFTVHSGLESCLRLSSISLCYHSGMYMYMQCTCTPILHMHVHTVNIYMYHACTFYTCHMLYTLHVYTLSSGLRTFRYSSDPISREVALALCILNEGRHDMYDMYTHCIHTISPDTT